MIDECIKEARAANMKGVAVVTRNGSFMAKKDIFLKKGFVPVDRAAPDFELLSLKFTADDNNPKFKEMSLNEYPNGLTVLRSPQCPYSVKNVDAIIQTAKRMNLDVRLIELEDAESAQQSPCAFGTFCIVRDGVILSHHPISNTRFENIIKSKK